MVYNCSPFDFCLKPIRFYVNSIPIAARRFDSMQRRDKIELQAKERSKIPRSVGLKKPIQLIGSRGLFSISRFFGSINVWV